MVYITLIPIAVINFKQAYIERTLDLIETKTIAAYIIDAFLDNFSGKY